MKKLLILALLISTSTFANVVMKTTMGTIVIELDYANTPNTAKNFEQYVKDGHFDGLIFHRVIDKFMIQGGGLTPDMRERKTRAPIQHEGLHAQSNKRGTIAMARTNDPHSATSQFYINVVDNSGLDYKAPTPEGYGYVVFGKVVSGMEVVDAIKVVKTTTKMPYRDVPAKPIIIESVHVE